MLLKIYVLIIDPDSVRKYFNKFRKYSHFQDYEVLGPTPSYYK